MFIKQCLTHLDEIATVTPETPIKEMLDLLKEYRLDSIPVIDTNGLFLGITGYTYAMKSFLESENTGASTHVDLDQGKVKDALHIMDPLTIHSDFEETLPVIVRYPFVPVVDENGLSFLGIVKISDIEAALASTYGHDLPGVRFLMAVVLDAPHELEHVVASVQDFDVNIISLVTFDAGDAAVRRIMLKIQPTPYVEEIKERLEQRGFRILNIKETQHAG
ncbi:CBS domain-containing protein [Marininema mesophilum]|uniref:CBS domain-containing protein n=1 Tax=Marininema mesophilum TaxID=1048340 RepID=A0A1H2QXN1_9BACL|nr:CBS domain-containing protein [Marininema mesophilum]SDW11936.1 CBS domain-containing protein [Marininema mesophilum]